MVKEIKSSISNSSPHCMWKLEKYVYCLVENGKSHEKYNLKHCLVVLESKIATIINRDVI